MIYKQPDFYHFSEASLSLVSYALEKLGSNSPAFVCDLFSGSGVIGLEYLQAKPETKKMFLVEKEYSFKRALDLNVQKIQSEKVEVLLDDVFNVNLRDCELVLLNPPFYDLRSGRLPLDELKKRCHFMIGFDWNDLEKYLARSFKKKTLIFMLNKSGLQFKKLLKKQEKLLFNDQSLYFLEV